MGATRFGRVLVQTFQPESRAVALAARRDVEVPGKQLARRKKLGYPPFRHVVRILVSGPDRDDVLQAGRELADEARLRCGDLLGPAELFRLRVRHRRSW